MGSDALTESRGDILYDLDTIVSQWLWDLDKPISEKSLELARKLLDKLEKFDER